MSPATEPRGFRRLLSGYRQLQEDKERHLLLLGRSNKAVMKGNNTTAPIPTSAAEDNTLMDFAEWPGGQNEASWSSRATKLTTDLDRLDGIKPAAAAAAAASYKSRRKRPLLRRYQGGDRRKPSAKNQKKKALWSSRNKGKDVKKEAEDDSLLPNDSFETVETVLEDENSSTATEASSSDRCMSPLPQHERTIRWSDEMSQELETIHYLPENDEQATVRINILLLLNNNSCPVDVDTCVVLAPAHGKEDSGGNCDGNIIETRDSLMKNSKSNETVAEEDKKQDLQKDPTSSKWQKYAGSETRTRFHGLVDFLSCEFQTDERLKVSDVLHQLTELTPFLSSVGAPPFPRSSPRKYQSKRPKFTALYCDGHELVNMLALQDYDLKEGAVLVAIREPGALQRGALLEQGTALLQDVRLRRDLRRARITGKDLILLKPSPAAPPSLTKSKKKHRKLSSKRKGSRKSSNESDISTTADGEAKDKDENVSQDLLERAKMAEPASVESAEPPIVESSKRHDLPDLEEDADEDEPLSFHSFLSTSSSFDDDVDPLSETKAVVLESDKKDADPMAAAPELLLPVAGKDAVNHDDTEITISLSESSINDDLIVTEIPLSQQHEGMEPASLQTKILGSTCADEKKTGPVAKHWEHPLHGKHDEHPLHGGRRVLTSDRRQGVISWFSAA